MRPFVLKTICTVAALVVFSFVYFNYVSPSETNDAVSSIDLHQQATDAQWHAFRPSNEIPPTAPKHVRLIIPASAGDANLCKTLLSAAVLGYPTPYLVNWGKTFDDPTLIFGGSHVAKIDGILNRLNSFPPEADDDIAIIIDGYDLWFQLRPQVLIDRYFDIIDSHQERLRRAHGARAVNTGAVSAKVLFSAQKRCWPKEQDHPACWAVPESTLPTDVYGPLTDQDVADEKNPYLKYRQRYLNSGSAIGPISALRRIFERASEKLKADANIGSDQGIFAEIFGEQEYSRLLLRTGNRPFRHWDNSPDMSSQNFEFGLHLDYDMRLVQATVFSEYDTAWVRTGDQDEMKKAFGEADIPLLNLDSSPFQERVRKSEIHDRVPYDTFYDRLADLDWTQVPLFTNLWTGISPVAVHHNAHRDGLKARREEHWPLIWFQAQLRSLLNSTIYEPVKPLAVSDHLEFWSDSVAKDGVQYENGYLTYETICSNGTEAEIFRDELGPWKSPMPREKLVNA